MAVRELREGELTAFVDDLWLPFAREMETVDPSDALRDGGVRECVRSYVGERLEDEGSVTYVAEDRGLIGYVTVEKKRSAPVFVRGARGHISGLYVVPGRRNEGVATRLLTRAEAWARRRGCDRLSLDVHVENDAAQSLYWSAGFETKRHRLSKPL